MKVWIKRSYKAGIVSEVDINEIDGVLWDNTSGGRKEKHFGYALYGYINYNLAKELVDCSGKHGHIAGSAKIMIPKSLNCRGENKEAYRLLSEQAGVKPACREAGQIACTKRILEILVSEREIIRKSLREKLILEKYESGLIRRALKTMEKDGRLNFAGKACHGQVISLGNF